VTSESEAVLQYRVNRHVERLQRYIPLDAGADQLVHELVDVDEATELETRAEGSIHAAVLSPNVRVVLLTGDAGHGKTRLCCSLLERLGMEKMEAAEAVRARADGGENLWMLPDGQGLRIVKDISDVSPDEGARVLRRALQVPDQVSVVCANEGRLRDVASRSPDEFVAVLARLEDGLREGDAAPVDGIVIINLNFQSVAANEQSLVGELLERWVGDGRNWSVCGSCRAEALCPIRENRRLLDEEQRAGVRRARWAELLRIAERTGTVITIRELLVTLAYALTSGLRCADVHRHVDAAPVDQTWQWRHLFHEVVFDGMGLLERTSPGLRMPPAMARLDPGRFADRRIDEALIVDVPGHRFRPRDPTGDVIGVDWRDQSAGAVAAEQLALTRFQRRRAFFEEAKPSAASRIGIRFAEDFELIVAGSGKRSVERDVRDRVVKGLAAVQGIAVSGERPSVLPIVEPALAGRRGGIAILDRDFRLADVRVVATSVWWSQILGRDPEVPAQVDWNERELTVAVGEMQAIHLTLRSFELLCSAGDGLDLQTADPGVARRLLLRLASMAGEDGGVERIQVIEPGGRWQIDLDVDDQLIGTRT
jgi:hypothetical protein